MLIKCNLPKSYGNVNLISSTPYYTEDINKNIITAKYVELLLKELDYKENIYLWLWPERDITFKAYFETGESQQKGLNVIITEKETNVFKTLNLVENVILNQKSLEKERDKLLSWYNSAQSELVKKFFLTKFIVQTMYQKFNIRILLITHLITTMKMVFIMF